LRRGATASREARRNDDTTRFHTKRFVFGPPIGRPLRSEPLSGSNRDAGPHQAVAQLDPEQNLLRLRAAMTHRVKQSGIESSDAGQHLRVAPIALTLVLDRAQLARIGNQDPATLFLEKAADPGTQDLVRP